MRKANLARLLARRVDGIFLSDFEQGEIGPDLFRHACLMGLEGMVSKHRESTYRGGRFRSLDQGQEPAASGVQPACRISSVEALSQERCRASCVNLVVARPNLRVARAPARKRATTRAGALPLAFRRPAVHSLSTARRIAFVDNLLLRMRRRRKSASSPRSYSQEGWITAADSPLPVI